MMKSELITIGMIAGLLCSGMVSCKRSEEPKPDISKNESIPQVQEESHHEVILTGDAGSLTMADYDRCIDVHRIQGNMFSERALANPRFQRDEVMRCFQTKLMQTFLKKQGINISADEHAEAVRRWTNQHEVADEQALAAKLGISLERLHDEINDTILPLVLQKKLVQDLTPSQAREMFNVDMRQISLEIASFDNTPTDSDVDDYLKDNQSDIMKYLSSHQELLNGPPSVSFVRLGYSVEDADGQQKTELLRKVVIEQGMDAAITQCRRDQSQGCVVVNDKDNLYTESRNEENVWAFRVPVGSVSEVDKMPERYEIRISTEILPPERYDIKDPIIQKLLTRQVMKDVIPAGHLIFKLRPALDNAKNVDFRQVVESLGGTYQNLSDRLENLERSGGLAGRQITALLKGLKPEEVGLFSDPLVENGRMYVIRVTQMALPSEAEFAENQEQWRIRKSSDIHYPLVNGWLEANMPQMTTLNLEPIQKKYGVLQANGDIK